MFVSQILKQKASDEVLTVPPDMPVSEAAKTLSERRIGALVVSSDGVTPQGILSERDIVTALAKSGGGCLLQSVGELMTSEVQTCSPHDTSDEILQRMTEGRFRHLPVVEDGKMVGLISIGDVVKARLSELEMEKGALESMIQQGY